MNVNSRIARANFTGYASGIIASFTGLRRALTKVKVNAIGVSDCNVVVCGKNIFNRTTETQGYYIDVSGELTSSTGWCASDYIKLNPNTTYTFTYNSSAGSAPRHCFYNADKNLISSIATTTNTITFTTPNNTVYARFSYRESSTNVQLENGSISTSYEEYTDETYTIPVNQTVTQIEEHIGVNNIFVDENVDPGTVEVYYVTI